MRAIPLLASLAVCLCACGDETAETVGDSGDANVGEESDDEGSSSEGASNEPPYHCDFSMFDEIEPLWTTKLDMAGSTLEVTDSAILLAGPRAVDGVYIDEGFIERRTLAGDPEWFVTVPGLTYWASADTVHLYFWNEKTQTLARRALQDASDDGWTTEAQTINRINAVGKHVVVSRGHEFALYDKLTGEPVDSFQWYGDGETTAYGNIIAPMPDEGYLVGIRTGEFAVHRLMGIAGFWMNKTLDIEGYQPSVPFVFPRAEGIWIGTSAGWRELESESMVMLLSNDGREQWRKPIEPCGSWAGVELSTSFAQTEDGLLGIASLTTYSKESIYASHTQDLVVRLDWSGELTGAYRVEVPPEAVDGRVTRLSHHQDVTVVAFTNGGWAEDLGFYLAQLPL